jgi:hypothetical protein
MSTEAQRPHAVGEFLADRDVPCPACGYNLRDLSSARCPECGLALRLPLTARPSRGAAWWLGVVGIAGTAVALGDALVVSCLRSKGVEAVVAGLGLWWMFAPAKRWLRTPRGLAKLPRHKKQERVAVWWLALLLAAAWAAVAASGR